MALLTLADRVCMSHLVDGLKTNKHLAMYSSELECIVINAGNLNPSLCWKYQLRLPTTRAVLAMSFPSE